MKITNLNEARIFQDTFSARRNQLLAAGYENERAALIASEIAEQAVEKERARVRIQRMEREAQS